MERAGKTLVIGVGNTFRRDDGVGVEVARRLQDLSPPHVSVTEESGEGAALMEAWKDADRVILIDAVSSGSPPGTIHRLDASVTPIPSEFFHYSTHAFSVAEAVEMARALDRLPEKIRIYGIEGRDFGTGTGLSPEVEQAAEEVIAEIHRGIVQEQEITRGVSQNA